MNMFKKVKILMFVSSIALITACSSVPESEKAQIAEQKALADYTAFVEKNQNWIVNRAKDAYVAGKPYKEYIEKVAIKNDLPLEVYAFPVIESNYSEKAESKSGAKGMWQITTVLAKGNRMVINDQMDERENWKKSTDVALMHIKNNADMFDSYELGVLAYISGYSRVRSATIKNRTDNILVLMQDTETFNNSEKLYIYKYMAISNEYRKLNLKNTELTAGYP